MHARGFRYFGHKLPVRTRLRYPRSMTTPAGATIDRQVYVSSQALPAAGAQLDPGLFKIPKGTTRVTYWITYTRGAAGGYCQTEAKYSNGTEEANENVQNPTLTTVAPYGILSQLLEKQNSPVPASAAAITYCLTYERFPAATTGVRLLIAEAGVVGTPGTVAVAITADVEPDTAEARPR